MSPMPPLLDLYTLKEDERIRVIGEMVMCPRHEPKPVAILLEKNEPEKVARYIKKVTERYPGVKHLDTTDGPVDLVVTVRFAQKGS